MSAPEYITFLAHMRGDSGDARLLAGTQSRLYCNTGLDASWRILLDGLGGVTESGLPVTRWKFAQIGNISLFTNGLDRPYSWQYEGEPDPVTGNSASLIDDFVALDVTLVRVIGEWRGFAFAGNVVSEGEIFQNRIYWSDFNDPLSWTPLPGSLAGYVELGADERVLAMAPLGGVYRVYTDKAIYDVNLVGGDEVFNFREVYRGPQALRFENSLVNLGDTHIYAGEDTLYSLNEFDRTPRKLDWLYRASGAIFNGVDQSYLGGIPDTTISAFGPINRSACHTLVGGYDEAHRTMWYSWASDSDTVPSHSLIMQLDIGKASIVDSGFTAFVPHLPSYQVSVRRWLADMGICTPLPVNGEGNPAPQTFVQDTTLTCVRNNVTNDWENPLTAPDDTHSLCAKVSTTPSLEPSCDQCGNGFKFVMASAQDKCLKQYDADFYARTYCTTDEGSRSGQTWSDTNHPTTVVYYADSGYVTILQTDALDAGSASNKTVTRFFVEYDAAPATEDVPNSYLWGDLGYGAQPHSLVWQTSPFRPIDRLSPDTESAMKAQNIRPNRIATFPFFRTGSQIGYRLMIADKLRGPSTGGACSLNEIGVTIRASHGDFI